MALLNYFKFLRIYIVLMLFCLCTAGNAQDSIPGAFKWGNTFYTNLDPGDSILFQGQTIELLNSEQLENTFRINKDTLTLKVSRRALPKVSGQIRLFVADNKTVKSLTTDSLTHGLLTKSVVVGLSNINKVLLPRNKFTFPINYSDGFIWNMNEEKHMFAYLGESSPGHFRSFEGIALNLNDARGREKHLIVAIEESTVIWIEENTSETGKKEACVLLRSESSPGIYYVYDHLYTKNVFVKKGDKLKPGYELGYIWGNNNWGFLQFAAVKSDSVPNYQNRYSNVINCFPQFVELYRNNLANYSASFTKGKIEFGRPSFQDGGNKNVDAFENYSGKGWIFTKWNPADKVEYISINNLGNARLKKTLFQNSPAECINPFNFFEYFINVRNGVYRISANVGDLKEESWQKVEFNGVLAAEYTLNAGELKWTSEKAVKVTDGKLRVRIYHNKNKIAGISEIVFQRAY